MNTKVHVEGLDELRAKFAGMGDKIDAAAEKAIKITAVNIRTDVVKQYNSGPASGRVYKQSNPSRVHQASMAGEAPMTDTGRLVGSIYMDIKQTVATIGSRLVYAAALEYGTRRMGARPAWVPAAARARKALPEILSKQVKKAMK